MQAFTNDADLTRKNVDEKYIVFFQVWRELTDYRTLDSYQYRIMNSLSSINELAEVLSDRLRRAHNSNHNIDECKAETKSILKEDPVLKNAYTTYWNAAVNHLSDKTDTDAQQRALRYQLEYIYNHVAPEYFEKLVDTLEMNISEGNVKEIISNTNRVISNCVTRGWSPRALFHLADILQNSQTDTNKWETFKAKLLKSQPDEYHVFIPLKLRVVPNKLSYTAVIENIIEMGVNVFDVEEIKEKYVYMHISENDEKYMVIPVTAFDYYSASHIALSKYANILNMFSFYNIIEAWNIRDISWTVANVDLQKGVKLRPKELYGTYDYLESATRTLRTSLGIAQGENLLQTKLSATYSYANMGKASYSIEEKYMNTWVALESLCRSDVYENIISNVLETVPAALCNRYIFRKYRNFVEDCKRCGITLDFSKATYKIKNSNKYKLVEDILEIFKDDDLYVEFKNKCKVNSLLAERCEELRELAVDGEKMVAVIEKHYKNVRQQISRLYRVRNAIAHTAVREDAQMVRYIEHLEDYLSEFVSEIVRYSKEKETTQIEVILEMIKDNHRQFTDIVNGKKKNGKYLALEDGLFRTGILNLI